ncbi:bifunctional hydroxymethylpyrimidine kinase/phosphomethylpyrimidine kinase [Ponticaulis sp.]|uniref:bifunctional hydroxymethylpyrimidine kinase/phosphomethylpyrimidine kinase n=1 Tax=Ponticaulis sp. TaxID=2020902 RepID=UPI000B675CD5|nr:bifunctional hydroxymethylpyrimidine kinase/phosphomethylpyrimidine kinase [Ponticaulis sp.]MAI90584.1 bifunctional hydroxymethylpyrimidine kinase/phosphomethylpyrimidine kinase [Ponticaulis sp.]OUX99099.1 MAG: bifunctional hydroxymethylpyrimidine kinase/phosphomethylpyrimidine kinase [Hyphomonadaceae bacterium TMED5]|tara:strand:+ start:118631 stop:119458 length:828 start_codon:yes stop_codon:yes gene_type:complete
MSASETTEKINGRVLSVAGSDSGGGAGIQADIKAITMNGGYAMTAVTAITVQNTQGVYGVIPVPLDAIAGQIRVTLSDIGADVIKTGMLGDRKTIETVSRQLNELAPDIPRVIDPVMVATSGDRLLAGDAVDVLKSLLVPDAALLTPNAPEAEILSGRAVESVDGQRRAAERLMETGAKAVLVKGGHISSDVITDVLQTEYDEFFFEAPRIDTESTHGTGCTLASSIATYMALGSSLPDAVEAGREYLLKALESAKPLGKGHGPVNHGWPLGKER